MRGRVAAIAAGAALALALAGCGGPKAAGTGTPSATAAPTATFTCTPASGTPAACTPEQYAQEQAALALAEQAKGVYQRAVDEIAALEQGGGATTPSAELAQVAGGPYLTAQQAQLASISQRGLKLSGSVTIKKLTVASGATGRGYDAALFACLDASKATLVQQAPTPSAAPVSKGRLIAETAYFKRDADGTLRVWDAEAADTKGC